MPVEILGVLPAAMNAEHILQSLRLPSRFPATRLTLSGGAAVQHTARLVLLFQPHFQTLPWQACEVADKIAFAGAQDVRVMAVFCISQSQAASGQVKIPAAHADPASITGAINLLLRDVLSAPASERKFSPLPSRR